MTKPHTSHIHARGPVDNLEINGLSPNIKSRLDLVQNTDGIAIYELELISPTPLFPEPIMVSWHVPAINIKGIWKPNSDFSKRIPADWEHKTLESGISVNAPIVCLFGHSDENILSFALSNGIHNVKIGAQLREEDNCIYCSITLFPEKELFLDRFCTRLYLDFTKGHFSTCIKRISRWWETIDGLLPARVPPIAKTPLYSTWYQFHQDLNAEDILAECHLASELGYGVLIIDDGWQTLDSNRGYDYTGDWEPKKIPEMANFVARIHATGMKVALWYSVPFCGKKSKVHKRFKGKFLTKKHRWAPVLDPRFPEVRQYLISTYTNALKNWDLDGFKFDFIDEFRLYGDSPRKAEAGMDYISVNQAVDRLMTDIFVSLNSIKPDIFVEFRQKYTGPAMRKYGNVFRAFDCPGDATMNKVRIADIKLLNGKSATHSDMVTWHPGESLEVAALHIVSTLFGIPQLSVMLRETPPRFLRMIRFYTRYWNEHADIFTQGDFRPSRPLANYPVQKVVHKKHMILGVYDDYIILWDSPYENVHILNAKMTEYVIVKVETDLGVYDYRTFSCEGEGSDPKSIPVSEGLMQLVVPPCGMIQLRKK